MSDLNLMLNREAILLGGGQGSGKSYSIAKLIEEGQDEDAGFTVMVIDRDRGMGKVLREVFGKTLPENLDYRLIKTWDDMIQAITDAFDILGAGDWLCFEHCGKIWDFVQEEFARAVYGESVGDHLLMLRAEAQEALRAAEIDLRDSDAAARKEANKTVSGKMQYSGLDGRNDWGPIKRMHNGGVFDKVIVEADFNVLTTTAMTPLQDEDLKKGRWPDFHRLGLRPEGEKHQIYRHDTVAIAYQKEGQYLWRTDLGMDTGKDRGRELHRDVPFDNVGFVRSYLDKVEA